MPGQGRTSPTTAGSISSEHTMRCTHLSPDGRRDAARLLDAPAPALGDVGDGICPMKSPATQRVTEGELERERDLKGHYW